MWLIAMANLIVVFHIYWRLSDVSNASIRYDRNSAGEEIKIHTKFCTTLYFQESIRCFYHFIGGICFPFSSGLLGFFVEFAFAPTTYFLPCDMWLAIYKPKQFNLSWVTNSVCMVMSILLMILSPIGGLR